MSALSTLPYPFMAFLAILIFALVHLYGEKLKMLRKVAQGRILSFGGGVAIAYVFIDLLPKLSESDSTLRKSLEGLFPFVERHAYIMALLGFLLFFILERAPKHVQKKRSYWISLSSYGLFNFLVGYAVVDKNDPEVQPLVLFTFAMALHYFVNDYTLSKDHGDEYDQTGRWILVLCLFFGWLTGIFFTLPAVGVALISAFIGGGVIMNVTRHELPKENPHSSSAFLVAALCYTVILLAIGNH